MKRQIYCVRVDSARGVPYEVTVYPHGTREELDALCGPSGYLPILRKVLVQDPDVIPMDLLNFVEQRGERFVGTMPVIGRPTDFYLVTETQA
jgi:hypothetical protein